MKVKEATHPHKCGGGHTAFQQVNEAYSTALRGGLSPEVPCRRWPHLWSPRQEAKKVKEVEGKVDVKKKESWPELGRKTRIMLKSRIRLGFFDSVFDFCRAIPENPRKFRVLGVFLSSRGCFSHPAVGNFLQSWPELGRKTRIMLKTRIRLGFFDSVFVFCKAIPEKPKNVRVLGGF